MKEAAATDQNFSGASAGVVGRSPHTVVRYDAECDTEGQGPESHSTIYIYTIVPAEGARARVPFLAAKKLEPTRYTDGQRPTAALAPSRVSREQEGLYTPALYTGDAFAELCLHCLHFLHVSALSPYCTDQLACLP